MTDLRGKVSASDGNQLRVLARRCNALGAKSRRFSDSWNRAGILRFSAHRSIAVACCARGAVAICAVFGIVGYLPTIAIANTPITRYAAIPSTTQAGGHPDLEVSLQVENRILQNKQNPCNCEDAKDADAELPAGFIGNPHSTPQCTLAEFAANECSIESQVGIANIGVSIPGLTGVGIPFNSAIYNIVPPPEEAGLLGFKVFGFTAPVFSIFSARTATDYGLDVRGSSIPHAYPLLYFEQQLWGVPAAPIHDALRINAKGGNPYFTGELCNANGEPTANEGNNPIINDEPSDIVKPCGGNGGPPIPSNSPEIPFLQNPTVCGSSLSSSMEVLSYDGGITEAHDPWPEMIGCDQLGFNPSLYAQPTSTAADSASGVDVDLSVPQEVSPTLPSPTELRATSVTFPEGFSINPNAADGKDACTNAEARFGTEEEAQCPEYSKVGSLTIESSALPGPLPGYVYLGQPIAGNRYRLFLVANGFATHVKLAGTVTANSQTGQLTIDFPELPQTPITTFNLHIFGSERGLLATPTQCGTYPVTSTFTPWDASLSPQTSTQYFSVTSGPDGLECPGPSRPFSPAFEGVSLNHSAATHTPLAVQITRPDGDQDLVGTTVTLPPGLLATLNGVAYCPPAALKAAEAEDYSGSDELANPSCPADSLVGSAVTGAGAGTHPVYVDGRIYLSGPYKSAPLSLAVITPVISGPYDLGNVVVRAALRVNAATAQITAVSDPLPAIFQGIPLRIRSIRLEVNRDNFTLNPSNCDPFTVTAEVFGNQGAHANLAEHYQVANCGTLDFAPKLALELTGSTKRVGNPALHSVLTAKPGEANIAKAVVTLPRSEFIDNAHIQTPCTRSEFAEGSTPGERCPANSVIGFARAETTLLEKALEGPVFLRSDPENSSGLPDIVAALNGQINIDLIGRINTVSERLRTTFEAVPDAPVSRFTLSLDGGSRGLLQNSVNLCKAPLHLSATLQGQNGKSDNQSQRLAVPCGKRTRHAAVRAHHLRHYTWGGR